MRTLAVWLLFASVLVPLTLSGCGEASEPTRTATGRPVVGLPTVRPVDACPVSPVKDLRPFGFGRGLGRGPAYPVGAFTTDGVLEIAAAANFRSRVWGGEKVLWVQAPGAPRGLVVSGRRLDSGGQVRFEEGATPELRLSLPAPDRRSWVDRPSYTRIARGGCYAYVVSSATHHQVIVFRAVKIAHRESNTAIVAGRSAQTMERALVQPRGQRFHASPSEADCRRPNRQEVKRSPFGGTRRVFSCRVTDEAGSARYDVHFLHNGCYLAARQRQTGRRSQGIQACH